MPAQIQYLLVRGSTAGNLVAVYPGVAFAFEYENGAAIPGPAPTIPFVVKRLQIGDGVVDDIDIVTEQPFNTVGEFINNYLIPEVKATYNLHGTFNKGSDNKLYYGVGMNKELYNQAKVTLELTNDNRQHDSQHDEQHG